MGQNRENKHNCKVCSHRIVHNFYLSENLPVHNNIVYAKKEDSMNAPTGNNNLVYCGNCAIVYNKEFDNNKLNYSENYNNTRGYSKAYKDYIEEQIASIQKTAYLNNKKILEIGCGNGDFLTALCQRCSCYGIGYEPAYEPAHTRNSNVEFHKEYFGGTELQCDILLLRHVLEHIESPLEFLHQNIRKIKFKEKLIVIVEVPDFEWIAQNGAFFDVTYEHCNYFTKESLLYLVKSLGGKVIDINLSFNNQYINIIFEIYHKAKTASTAQKNIQPEELIKKFVSSVSDKKKEINNLIQGFQGDFSVWGAAGKGTILLNLLSDRDLVKVPFVVDINSKKQEKYVAGTVKKIFSPERLCAAQSIADIIVMNPIYYQEIKMQLDNLDLKIDLHTI